MSHAIVTPEEMYAAEQRVFDAGTPSFDVMTVAGEAVADRLHEAFSTGLVRVLCGPGGNGGDGFIAAHRLREHGHEVRVYLLGKPEKLKGDSKRASLLWNGPVMPLDEAVGAESDVTLDALFGGGLSRPLEGAAAELAEERGPVVSVDVPSGLDGLTARPIGPCFTADLTVTFAAYRPAHVLSPGRGYCGDVHVQEIGVPVPQTVRINHPAIWAVASRVKGDERESLDSQLTFYHEEAFVHAYPDISQNADNFIDAAKQAADISGTLVLVAAGETIIAEPAGRSVIVPELASDHVSEAAFRQAVREAIIEGLPLLESACKAAQASRRL